MFSSEILKKLSEIPTYVGVFPRDKLSKSRRRLFSLVSNTDDSRRPGEHWVAIIVLPDRIEYFDFFGLPPFHPDFVKFIKSFKKILLYNTLTIQDLSSIKCGEFCIAFIKYRSLGYTFKSFLKKFSKETNENDEILIKLLKKI